MYSLLFDITPLFLSLTDPTLYTARGATVGKLPCLPISSSVTAFGREMIELTKNTVVEKYSKANGYAHDAVCIYGDTDSVMVKFGVATVAEAMTFGEEAAAYVSTFFLKPIKLEFEKVYFPYLLLAKKRYSGVYYSSNPDKHDRVDCKGIESTRRDNCLLVKEVIDRVLTLLLINMDVDGALLYVQGIIADLLQNKIDISKLVISKSYAKATYAGLQPHVVVAKKLFARDPSTAPALGARIPYVIIRGSKGATTSSKAEDPLFALNNNLVLDSTYYVENQLAKPLLRIFEPISPQKAKTLLNGDHMRKITLVTPSTGGMMSAFTVKRKKCLGCKVVMDSDDKGPVCKHCEPRLPEIYTTHLAEDQLAAKTHQALQIGLSLIHI